MAKTRSDLYGTVELLVLKALSWGPIHGYGVARWVELVSDDELHIEEGSLYPALHRLEAEGWVEAEWGVSDCRRRAKRYRLTALGRDILCAEERRWECFVATMTRVLAAVPDPTA